MTNDLIRRVSEHKSKIIKGFSRGVGSPNPTPQRGDPTPRKTVLFCTNNITKTCHSVAGFS